MRRHNGRATDPAIDLGLAILECLAKPNQPLTAEDIAAWADCTKRHIIQIQHQALRRLAKALKEFEEPGLRRGTASKGYVVRYVTNQP